LLLALLALGALVPRAVAQPSPSPSPSPTPTPAGAAVTGVLQGSAVAYGGGASLVPWSSTAGTVLAGGLLFSLPADTNPLGPDVITARAQLHAPVAAAAATARCRCR
jgi:hypothetical protein